ncbi:MAG: cellulase family glycosylhydrolase, partial [Lachnospiraceae bacterium]
MKCQLKRLGAMLMAFVLVVTSGIMGIPTKVYAQTSKTDKMDVTEEEATKASGGLSISGNKLLDGNGKEIILRGVNIPHAWYPKYTKSSIEDIAALGSNAVRVVLSSGDAYTKNTKSELEDIIKWSKQTGQICILELHDFTGSSKDEDITQNAVSYWREMKDIINENKDYVILNIANEWCGQWKTGDLWADTYSQAIPALRNAGIENVIMVDTPGYGNEISVAAKDTNRILQSDPTGNTMFSAHVYGSFGKDASANDVGGTGEAIKAGLDQLTATGACYAIGEFGFWQNFDEVDERTLVDYCADHKIGWMAWSWAGNTGVEHEPLDMTSVKTFSKDDLTVWGKWVFGTKNGIQDTSVLAYSGKTYTGEKITGVPDSVPTPDIKIDGPVDNGGDDVEIQPGNLKDYHWLTGHEMVEGAWKELKFDQADDGVIKIDNLSAIKGADNTATFQTELKDKGEDWSSHKTIDLIVKNNNTVATMQLAFIMKCGVCLDDEGNPYPAWVQTRTLDPSDNTQFSGQPYVNVPHNKTTHIRFQIDEKSLDPMNPISAADAIRDVRSFGFRVMQGASGIVNGDLEILAMGFDWPDDKYAHEIAELNRPKNINRWSWEDVNGTEGTMVPTPDGDKISFAYTMVPKDDGSYCAVNNAQTNPGGKHDVGEDWSAYKSVSATVTNKGTDPVKLTFICKTSSNWTWAENYGKTATKPDTEETEIAPGESLDLTYSLVDPTWKTLNSQWEPTDSLKELNLVKALAWKVYSDSPSTGVIEVSNFSVNFGDGPQKTEPSTDPKPSEPSVKPSEKPSEPSEKPSQKVSEPSVQPSQKVSEPSVQPSQKPSEPSVQPSQKVSEPSVKPSQKVSEPSVKPSQKVSEPSVQPSQKVSEPSVQPSQKVSEPSVKPSQKPSEPSVQPSQKVSEPSEKP